MLDLLYDMGHVTGKCPMIGPSGPCKKRSVDLHTNEIIMPTVVGQTTVIIYPKDYCFLGYGPVNFGSFEGYLCALTFRVSYSDSSVLQGFNTQLPNYKASQQSSHTLPWEGQLLKQLFNSHYFIIISPDFRVLHVIIASYHCSRERYWKKVLWNTRL